MAQQQEAAAGLQPEAVPVAEAEVAPGVAPPAPGPPAPEVAPPVEPAGAAGGDDAGAAAAAAALLQLHLGGGGGGGRRKAPTLTTVDATSWETFERRFRIVGFSNNWNNERMCAELASGMAGDASEAVAGIPYQNVGFEALVAQYRAIFVPPSASEMAISEFDTCRQKSDETLLQWHSRVRVLYTRAYPQDLQWQTSANLIKQFCRGVRRYALLHHLLTNRPANYAMALTTAQNYLASLQLLPARAKDTLGLNAMEAGATDDGSAGPSCWGCGGPHVLRNCPQPGRATGRGRGAPGGRPKPGRGGTSGRGSRRGGRGAPGNRKGGSGRKAIQQVQDDQTESAGEEVWEAGVATSSNQKN